MGETLSLTFERSDNDILRPDVYPLLHKGLCELMDMEAKYIKTQFGYVATRGVDNLLKMREQLSKDDWVNRYRASNQTLFFIARHQGRPVGFIEYTLSDLFVGKYDSYVHGTPTLNLKNIYTLEEYRRSRVASRMIDMLNTVCKKLFKIQYLSCEFNAFNYQAVKFFEKLHFRIFEKHYCYQEERVGHQTDKLTILKPTDFYDKRSPEYQIASNMIRENIRLQSRDFPTLGGSEDAFVKSVVSDIVNNRRLVCFLDGARDGMCVAGIVGGGISLLNPLLLQSHIYCNPTLVKDYIDTIATTVRRSYNTDTFIIRSLNRTHQQMLERAGCHFYNVKYITESYHSF